VARGDHGEMPAVPITVRQLEAIVRISESLARMQLQPVATEAHVREAIDLFKISTMDAVKSGATRSLTLAAPSRVQRLRHRAAALLFALLDAGTYMITCIRAGTRMRKACTLHEPVDTYRHKALQEAIDTQEAPGRRRDGRHGVHRRAAR